MLSIILAPITITLLIHSIYLHRRILKLERQLSGNYAVATFTFPSDREEGINI